MPFELDLQYNRARYYDANTQRWLSQDPLGFDAGDSNLYRYVNNGPTGATDPSGLLEVLNPQGIAKGNIGDLDKNFTDASKAYGPLAKNMIDYLNAEYKKAGLSIELKVPEKIDGLIIGYNTKKDTLDGVQFEAGTLCVVHHLVFLQWDLKLNQKEAKALKTLPIGFTIVETNQMKTLGKKSANLPDKTWQVGLADPRVAVGEFKMAQANGANYRVIAVDAPGGLVIKGSPMAYKFTQTSTVWQEDGKISTPIKGSELKKEVSYLFNEKTNKMTYKVFGDEGEVPLFGEAK